MEVEFTQLTRPEMGKWCERCALPSAYTVDWMASVCEPPTMATLRAWTKDSLPLMICEYRRVMYCTTEGCSPQWVTVDDT